MIVVFDTETTGLDAAAQVVEFAAVWMDAVSPWLELYRHSFMMHPTVPVEPEARAAHHITDAQLLHKPLAQECPVHMLLPTDEVWAAHNIDFDVRLLQQTWPGLPVSQRRVCTWRCAMHAWPSAPRYGNQVLRYWLDLKVLGADGLPAHRAMADALVTAEVLRALLSEHSLDELVDLTSKPVLLSTIRFGKHKGTPWARVDKGFLRWVLSKDFDRDVKHTARYHLGMEA